MVQVDIPVSEYKYMDVTIIGDHPLISGRYDGTKQEDKMKETLTDEKKFESSIYRTKDGEPGFPSAAIKKAMVATAKEFKKSKKVKGIDGTSAKVVFFIENEEIIPIKSSKPVIRIGAAKTKDGHKVKTVNSEFPAGWEMSLKIRFNSMLTDAETILMTLVEAGKTVGLGVMRPQTQGLVFGTFHVENAEVLE